MQIKKITLKDFPEWLSMSGKLWPDQKRTLPKTLREILKSPREKAVICRTAEGVAVGFANLSIRTDYVEGSDSSPVGYLEGIFVETKFRKLGVAKLLVKEGEKWAKQKGCREFGSDAELWNVESQKFHKAVGFKLANKIAAFIKKI